LRTHAKSAACRDTNQDPKSPSSGCLFRETLFGNVRVYNTVIKMVPIVSRRGLGMGIAFLAFGFRSSWGGLIREVFCPASSEPARTGQSPGDPEVTHLLSSFHSETLIPLSLELNSELLFCIDLNHFETIFTFYLHLSPKIRGWRSDVARSTISRHGSKPKSHKKQPPARRNASPRHVDANSLLQTAYYSIQNPFQPNLFDL
jgi:hypothetical protein